MLTALGLPTSFPTLGTDLWVGRALRPRLCQGFLALLRFLSFPGGQRRAPDVPGQALAGGGHRQLGPGLRHPQHARRLHQCPSLPQLDLRRPQGQCPTASTPAAMSVALGTWLGVATGSLVALQGGEVRWWDTGGAGARGVPGLLGTQPAP